MTSVLSIFLCHCSLLEASSRRTDIRTALQASPDWQKYVQGPLAEANNRQDVMQWACGRPSKETLSTFKSTDDIMIDETDAPEDGSVNRHLMRYNSLEDDDGDVSLPADKVLHLFLSHLSHLLFQDTRHVQACAVDVPMLWSMCSLMMQCSMVWVLGLAIILGCCIDRPNHNLLQCYLRQAQQNCWLSR